jgi:hypothetical protein
VKIAFPDHSKVDRLFARKRKLHLRAPSSQWQNGFEGMARVKAIPFENIEIKRNLPRAGAESLELLSGAPAQSGVGRSLFVFELHPLPKVVLQLGGSSARRNENDRF